MLYMLDSTNLSSVQCFAAWLQKRLILAAMNK